MKKKIIIPIILVIVVIVVCSCFIAFKSFNSKEDKKVDNTSNEVIKDKTDTKEDITNEETKVEDVTPKEESIPANESTTTESSNTTNNTPNNNSTKSNNTVTPSTPKQETNNNQTTTPTPKVEETPSCTPKKFTWSWVRADFSTFEECTAMGDKYLEKYGYYCDSYVDDCKTTYYMLSLYEKNGTEEMIDYHTVPIP